MPIPRSYRAPLFLGAVAVLAVALLAVRLRYASATAPPTGTVTVDEVTFDDDGTNLVVHARVSNGTAQRVFVYDAHPRGYDFEPATGTTVVQMHTIPRPPTGSSADCHVGLPSFREVGPLGHETLTVKVPRQVYRIEKAGPPTRSPVPSRVRFELGWSDQPIKLGPGDVGLCTFDAYTKLQALERGVAVRTSP